MDIKLTPGQKVIFKQPYFGSMLTNDGTLISADKHKARVKLNRNGMETDVPLEQICYFGAYRQDCEGTPDNPAYLTREELLFHAFTPKEITEFLQLERERLQRQGADICPQVDWEFFLLNDSGRITDAYCRYPVPNVQFSTTQTNK